MGIVYKGVYIGGHDRLGWTRSCMIGCNIDHELL
jgi:hypothetical protein